MKLRYEQLFSIRTTTAYYVDSLSHSDLVIEPTRYCKKQMSRFLIRSRESFGGISLYYQCSPFTNDATPFRPIVSVEKFNFKVSVTNADFWYYADVTNWEKDRIFLLKNPSFSSTGTISVLAGPLNTSILFRPMKFMYDVPLENTPGLLKVMDSIGNTIDTLIVRAKTPSEPVGKTEQYFVDLFNYTEGTYTLRHVGSGGNTDEPVYCSEDYSPGTLAIVEISYRTSVLWTGVQPFQQYAVNISSRSTDWFFDVYIRKRPIPPFLASQLSIKHLPDPLEPLRTFSVVGVADDVNGFVQFKSTVKLVYTQKPMRLQLNKSAPIGPVLDPLPLPSSITVQKDLLNNLITKVVVNV